MLNQLFSAIGGLANLSGGAPSATNFVPDLFKTDIQAPITNKPNFIMTGKGSSVLPYAVLGGIVLVGYLVLRKK